MSNQVALIDLPDGFTDGIASTTSTLMEDFQPVIILVLGVILVTVVIQIIIGALKK